MACYRSQGIYELEEIIRLIRNEHPALGESIVQGELRSRGYAVSRQQVRQAIQRTDPLSAALLWHAMTSRRPYSVPAPNSLWHNLYIGK